MSIYKRGKMFYMNFTVNGQRVFKSTGKFTKKEAKQVEANERQKMLEQVKLTPQQKAANTLLSEAIDQVYQSRWKTNKDGEFTYSRAIRLIKLIGDIQVAKINQEVVETLTAKLDKTNITPATVNRYLAILKTILRNKNQQWDFIKLRKERKGRIRVISREEEQQIASILRSSATGPRNLHYDDMADLVLILVDTGMRLSELLNLNYEDINFISNLISIWVNKGDRPRSIPMTKRVRAILEYRQVSNNVKAFTLSICQDENSWKIVRKKMMLESDKEFVIHALRHTCASRLVNGGVDLYVVKEMLGHGSIQITERYAHLNPVKLVQAVEVLE